MLRNKIIAALTCKSELAADSLSRRKTGVRAGKSTDSQELISPPDNP